MRDTFRKWRLPLRNWKPLNLYVVPGAMIVGALTCSFVMNEWINDRPLHIPANSVLTGLWISVSMLGAGLLVAALMNDDDPREIASDQVSVRQIRQYQVHSAAPGMSLLSGLVIAAFAPWPSRLGCAILAMVFYVVLSGMHWLMVYSDSLAEAQKNLYRRESRERAERLRPRCERLALTSIPIPCRLRTVAAGWALYAASAPALVPIVLVSKSVLVQSPVVAKVLVVTTLSLPSVAAALVVLYSLRFVGLGLDIIGNTLLAIMYIGVSLTLGLSAALAIASQCGQSWLILQVLAVVAITRLVFGYNVRASRACRPTWRTPLAVGWHRYAAANDRTSALGVAM